MRLFLFLLLLVLTPTTFAQERPSSLIFIFEEEGFRDTRLLTIGNIKGEPDGLTPFVISREVPYLAGKYTSGDAQIMVPRVFTEGVTAELDENGDKPIFTVMFAHKVDKKTKRGEVNGAQVNHTQFAFILEEGKHTHYFSMNGKNYIATLDYQKAQSF